MPITPNADPLAFREGHWPSPEEVDQHLRRGRRLHAEAVVAALRAPVAWLRSARPVAAPAPDAPPEAGNLRSPLTAIRSSAEILRDHPELSVAERTRFVEILLAEERRLERMLADALGGRRLHGR